MGHSKVGKSWGCRIKFQLSAAIPQPFGFLQHLMSSDLNRPLMEAAAVLDFPLIQDLLKRGLVVDPGAPRKRGWKHIDDLET